MVKSIFPIINLKISISVNLDDSNYKDLHEFFNFNESLSSVERIKKSTSEEMILMSNGELRKGRNDDLVNGFGDFRITQGSTGRFYWGDRKNFIDSEPYFFYDNSVLLGVELFNPLTLEKVGKISFVENYVSSMYNISALYKRNGIGEHKGLFRRENVKGKSRFLEHFLSKEDKSGYLPKDMAVNNKKLRLKLLENHYLRNIDHYSSLII